MARYIAKVIVAAGFANKCEVQIGYAIGKANPISIYVDTYMCEDDDVLTRAVTEVFDMRPAAIIERFDLRRPIYKDTAAYGHFGNPSFPWEQVKAEDVKRLKDSFKALL